MHIFDQKKALRESMNQRLSCMRSEERDAESRSVCRRILEHIPEGSTVCVYNALPTEPDLRLLITTLLERNDSVFMARFAEQALEFRQIADLDNLVKGELNIAEPPASSQLLPTDVHTIVVVPGRAFDRQCNRLGRGNGGYDKWIAKQKDIMTVGAAFECQVVNEVPTEKHDQPLHMVITGRETYRRETI